jgi:dTDP-4-dehydrorhamnose reductase
MRCLILGSQGQVARHLAERMPDAYVLARPEIDFTDSSALQAKILAVQPECIINCAAYTAVDKAESEPFTAWQVNANAPAAISHAANELDARVIHISTDYVFDGHSTEPYHIDSPVNPQTVYGQSKLAGEIAVQSIAKKHWILRTSWMFSEFGQNFVKTMLRLGRERNTLSVVADQIGVPTYADDISQTIEHMIESEPKAQIASGIFHVTAGPTISWFGFTQNILALAHQANSAIDPPKLEKILTADYPTAAKRPLFSVLQPSHAMFNTIGFTPDWELGLIEVMEKIL